MTLPKTPFIMPFWMERSMTVSSWPASMPVNWAWSDFFWTTFTLSTILAGIFLEANCGSSRKNVLPSIVILLIVCPFAVTEPSEPTSTPGSFLSKSSSMSLSVVLNEVALYSIVSFLMTIGLPVAETLAASRTCLSGSIFITPRLRDSFNVISLLNVL